MALQFEDHRCIKLLFVVLKLEEEVPALSDPRLTWDFVRCYVNDLSILVPQAFQLFSQSCFGPKRYVRQLHQEHFVDLVARVDAIYIKGLFSFWLVEFCCR